MARPLQPRATCRRCFGYTCHCQHVGHLDYASSPEFRAAVSRAQWAVIQTGLITSGLALFGVYVLATRINDLHLMNMYIWGWIPFGPLLVGLIAGSGYILASWWFGVRVGPGMVLTIMLLQIGALAFVALGIFILVVDPGNWLVAFGSIVFFGLCAGFATRLLVLRRRAASGRP